MLRVSVSVSVRVRVRVSPAHLLEQADLVRRQTVLELLRVRVRVRAGGEVGVKLRRRPKVRP